MGDESQTAVPQIVGEFMGSRQRKSMFPASADMYKIRAAQLSISYVDTRHLASVLSTAGRSPMSETLANISRMINADRIAAVQLAGINSPAFPLASLVLASTPQIRAMEALSATWAPRNRLFGLQIGQIISAQLSVATLFNDLNYQSPLRGLFESVTRYSKVQAHLADLTIERPGSNILRGYTTRAGQRYDRYITGLPARPIARRATVARLAGDTMSGLLVAESLTADSLSLDDREELADEVTTLVLEPWQSGPEQARTELFAVLDSLEPGNADWLKAAWDDIVRDGPKAASKIANCAIECIDRSLRAAAPEDQVAVWLGTVPSKAVYLDIRGKQTRVARISYIMRDRSKRDIALAQVQVESLVRLVQEVVNDLQSVKHGEAPTIAVMRSWVLATESALCQLFLTVEQRP